MTNLIRAAARQLAYRRRRLALVLAADFGVDLDRHVVGAAKAVTV
ncbi:hypothetical protein SRB5_45380 [Streptomyces sp. RB5]|uniref:Uncharacterized protein n=1 Tax=Streptomyces smaragdinus TaxID=2585196 RepID=A0A7K0CMW1_9ACTN|nr:hypothetical protein [Streptomyces smaragdinus]MQY14372.1 hypothetical protein [Streptomyces smaragdinus]